MPFLAAVNADFTLFRDLSRRSRGFKGMSARQNICAIERAAGTAEPAATLILGTLLLLIRP
jgi:hypothetical protein